jgi:hypothetical protein
VAEAGGVLGMIVPIEGGQACDDIRVPKARGVIVGRKIRTCLKQQEAAMRIGALSCGKNGAGRAAADDNDVEASTDSWLAPYNGSGTGDRHHRRGRTAR